MTPTTTRGTFNGDTREDTLEWCREWRESREAHPHAGSANRQMTDEQVAAARDYLREHPEEPLRNQKLADQLGVSPAAVAAAVTGATYAHVETETVGRRGGSLSDQQVTAIREHLRAHPEENLKNARLAERYGVTRRTIWRAATGRGYEHVDTPPVDR